MLVFFHELSVSKRSDLAVYSSQLASALHDQPVFQVRMPMYCSFNDFPNTNANLIPICNTKSQLKKGITFKFFKVANSSNLRRYTNLFISSIKRKSVKKPLLNVCEICYILWKSLTQLYTNKLKY